MTVRDIINEIAERISELEAERGFNNCTGSSQVDNKSPFTNLQYGKYSALVDLYEELTNSTWITAKRSNP